MKSKDQSGIVRSRLPGFTLVELLVVIVIVASLASITFTVAIRATNSAHKTKAMSNMKQLSNLAQTFSADNNNILMDVRETTVNGQKRLWAEHLLVCMSPTLEQNSNYKKKPGDTLASSSGIFSDPKALKQAKGKLPTSGDSSWRTFGYNARIGSFISATPGSNALKIGAKTIAQVGSPEKLILFIQCKLIDNAYPPVAQPGDVKNDRIDFNMHDGKSLVGFFDGHVGIYEKKNYPANDCIDPATGSTYSDTKLNEFWLGNSTPYPAP